MEQIILLFFRNALEHNPELKRAMQNFFRFYKENRELLIAVLALQAGNAPSDFPAEAAEVPEAEEKSRPVEVDSKKVLEEYLARACL